MANSLESGRCVLRGWAYWQVGMWTVNSGRRVGGGKEGSRRAVETNA